MPQRASDPASSSTWELVFPESLWVLLNSHLFPGDSDEHGAVVLAGIATFGRRTRLLVKDVVPAIDGIDYVPGQRGYRALSPVFIGNLARRAKREGLVYLAAHCHGGSGHVAFSAIDLDSHERGYPALVQLIGGPMGGLVLADRAVAGDLWLEDGERAQLSRTTVIGNNVVSLASDAFSTADANVTFDRQARLLGADGQLRLQGLRIAVVGLGGAGSMAAEMLVRLGVGELVYIDPDRLEPSNIARIVGSSASDALPPRRFRFWKLRSRSFRKGSALKVDIAKRAAELSELGTRIETHAVDVASRTAADALSSCDWIVLAADSQTARHIVNAIAHAYLIPVIQVGVKVPVDSETGDVGQLFCVARHMTPDSGCMWCNGLIDPTELQLEATGDEGKRARQYVGEDAPAPSVITLNGIAVSLGMTELLLSSAGLLTDSAPMGYERFRPRIHRFAIDEPRRDADCPYCGRTGKSLLAQGDRATIPTLPG